MKMFISNARRMPVRLIGALFVAFIALPAWAQFGVGWPRTPTLAVLGADAQDPRHAMVDEAVAYWNRALAEIGSGLRLNPPTHHFQPVPEDGLRALSGAILYGRGSPSVPTSLRGLPGDITVVLGDSEFVSFAGPFDLDGRRVVGIRTMVSGPLKQPNVAVNVITHEIGHALGLGHNVDPAMLMCGRPANCRPATFASPEPKLFPLAEEEKRQLLDLYPPAWPPGAATR